MTNRFMESYDTLRSPSGSQSSGISLERTSETNRRVTWSVGDNHVESRTLECSENETPKENEEGLDLGKKDLTDEKEPISRTKWLHVVDSQKILCHVVRIEKLLNVQTWHK